MKREFYVVDTGALVGWFDKKDPAHQMVRSGWTPLVGKFVTTGAVITETLHFLQPIAGGTEALARFIRKGLVVVDDAFAQSRLDGAVELMARYRDIPMDFADATLVLLCRTHEHSKHSHAGRARLPHLSLFGKTPLQADFTRRLTHC